MEFKKASRQGIKPLVGVFSGTGKGKTMSALLLARGFAGEGGKVGMIDTESGRGSLYSDVIPGGYEVLELRQPFSPDRYIEAIRTAEQMKFDVLVIDSTSHEWENTGGVTDMAMELSRQRSEKYNKDWDGVVQFGDWKQPKMAHAKFMLTLLQSPLPIICCLRAKQKSAQVKGTPEMARDGIIDAKQIGKTCIIKDSDESPIQDESFIYEMMVNLNINFDHSITLTKVSHPSLRDCFPKDKTTPITIEHGAKLAAWCNAAGKPLADLPDGKKLRNKKELELELWLLLKPKRIQGDKSWISSGAWQFIVDECEVDPNATIDSLTVSEIEQLIVRAKSKL